MNVRFIDTSIMTNLLGVPGKCDKRDQVLLEWQQVLNAKEKLIMPIATIIETGNHIAHIASGDVRRTVTLRFQLFLQKTADSEAPWSLYGNALDKEQIKYIAEHMEEFTKEQVGIGDMTIIYAYEKYLRDNPAIGTIMIWSADEHLAAYRQDDVCMKRRRKNK